MATSGDTSDAADAIVIGGGIIGCSIALRLAQARLSVVVIERGEPGAEASSAAAGMLAPQGETVELSPFLELCLASRDLYPSFVAEVEELSGERVGYRRDGTLLVAVDEVECRKLDEIYRAQSRHGLALERLRADAVRERVPGLSDAIPCGLFVPGDHWVDSERLSRAVAEACRRRGVRFRTGSEVKKLGVRGARVESIEVHPSGAAGAEPTTLSAGQFVLAAGCWSGELARTAGVRIDIEPCRGQVIEFDCSADLPLTVRLGDHYLVPRQSGRVLAGTTQEYVGYDKAVTGEGLRSILEGTARLAPLVKDCRFRRSWAGLRPDTADHLPVLGYGELNNLMLATGHFRNGILLAPLTAQLISELFLTRSTSRSIEAYHPGRFHRQGKAPGPSFD